MANLLFAGAFALLGLLLLLGRWRAGLLVAVAIGFLQDPLRKIAPGEPIYFVLGGIVAVGMCATVPLLTSGGFRLSRLFYGDLRVQRLLWILLLVILLQSFHSLLRFGSPILTGIGGLFYAAPLLALWLGRTFAGQERWILALLRWYVVLALMVGGSVLLSWSGVDSPLFEEVGAGIRIYERTLGYYIDAHSGLMRTSEVAAWHLGTGACLAVVLGVWARKRNALVAAFLIALGLLAISTLTGRRKVLGMATAFFGLYGILLWSSGGRSVRGNLFVGGLGASIIAFVFVAFGAEPRGSEGVGDYLSRAFTVWEDAGGRFEQLGIGAVGWAWNRGGVLGLGVGVAAQGAQHFGGGFAGGAGEGGLGKLMIELGLPGFIASLMLAGSLGLLYLRILRFVRRNDPALALLMLGLACWLAANVPVFIVASQIYGDPFVLTIIGLVAGFLLAGPMLVERRRRVAASRADMVKAGPATPVTPVGLAGA